MFGLKQKTSERDCPFINAPCKREKCEAWYSDEVEILTLDPDKPKRELRHACIIFYWNPMFLKGIARRQDGTQIAMEKARDNVRTGMAGIAQALGQLRVEIPLDAVKTIADHREH